MGKGHRRGWKKAQKTSGSEARPPKADSPQPSSSPPPEEPPNPTAATKGGLPTGIFLGIVAMVCNLLIVVLQWNGVVTVRLSVSVFAYIALTSVVVWAFSKWEVSAKWKAFWRRSVGAALFLVTVGISLTGALTQYRREHQLQSRTPKGPFVTVSPKRLRVTSKEWQRVDVVTVTNHEENPRYDVVLAIEPSTPQVEYELSGSLAPGPWTRQYRLHITQVDPKASYKFEVRSKLRQDAKSTEGEICFSVTDGTEEPKVPNVMIHH